MRSTTPWRDRMRVRPLSILGMTLVWALLWGSASPLIVLSGILIAWVVDVVFPLPPIHWTGRFRPLGFLRLLGHLLLDLVVSSLRILRLAFLREVKLDAGIVRVDLHTDDDLYQVAVAELLSLVPGTVVVEVVRHPRRLYLHALELHDAESVDKVQRMVMAVESGVVRAFGSAEQIHAFDLACLAHPAALTPQMEE
ncbi:hypothetical protein TESS_TESS_00392 [Tessaracoccus sp. O5.2]|nr:MULTISPECIES: Na+/H+ antiporter subunit E [Tessaracoccus]AQX15703.1 Na+/H+ antiporter subunit E [Tessaracoccus sp. T2.5-30]VEP40098.1 hypothetical protein TLA_TLA_01434 [Tessaracoccus lapidicaptus]